MKIMYMYMHARHIRTADRCGMFDTWAWIFAAVPYTPLHSLGQTRQSQSLDHLNHEPYDIVFLGRSSQHQQQANRSQLDETLTNSRHDAMFHDTSVYFLVRG
jgi:hypothetical protein